MHLLKLISLLITFLFFAPVQAGLIFTIDSPGVQRSQVDGTKLVETFDDWSRGNISSDQSADFGTYYIQGTPKILSARLWGGADGIGNYLFVSPRNNSAVTLEFDNPVGYFGFWWSAGDRGNLLQVNTLSNVYDFTTQTIFESIDDLTPYNGNPTNNFLGQNGSEPYGFINIFAESDAFKIESIRFYGSNFETDNHTTISDIQDPTGIVITAVSEPSSWAIFGLSLLPILYISRRRQSLAKGTINKRAT
ncbi:Npun_F0296 family exosortase-dependent surface protein [Vibrio alfacsensis]|uniref:Npun_F0296 family exosortase-dependent surface protein n=1 Tax=Vibrio alfacsensis TaxID=1074311 RepID=UPI001BEE5665|nr:hypothetical protein [Vibrio alfacsensis]BCN27342.1 hypothetical protein VYA_45340 [Vibrio alfacsensis]